MDTSNLETLLPGGAAFGTFGTLVFILARMVGHDRSQLTAADSRYKDEVADHEVTQQALDQERVLRRQAEDKAAELGRQVQALTEKVQALSEQVARQTEQVARQTEQITKQTEQIANLDREVAQLRGAGTP